jgi:hypothetical protein
LAGVRSSLFAAKNSAIPFCQEFCLARLVAVNPRFLMRRLRRLADENKLFSLGLLAGALLRLDVMLGYPGALWFAGDSYVYVGACLRRRRAAPAAEPDRVQVRCWGRRPGRGGGVDVRVVGGCGR